ncbi:MAG: preprotein translocase subunit SecG [Gammaproteobacteria bacterium]|nr:MAG: preprotein translocase subunit SecG [Gammaproteobacteria bacterium]
MKDIILVIDVLSAVGLVALVLLQQGKGADMGAAFGAGASQTLFGARGSSNFLSRTTAILATVFFLSNMALAWIATSESREAASVTRSVTETVPAAPVAPAVPAPDKVPEVPK